MTRPRLAPRARPAQPCFRATSRCGTISRVTIGRWALSGWGRLVRVLVVTTLLVLLADPASAHDDHEEGPLRVSIGWADEPAYSGLNNAVEVTVTLEDGAPVTDLGSGSLAVEVTFGTVTSVLALEPAADPGVYLARIVPTRPGTYAFHLTGAVKEHQIDITSTCSPDTFECVADVSASQFPVKDPSSGELSERLDRELARADAAESDATSARRLAVVSLGVGGVALVVAVALGLRRTRPPAS